MTLPLLLPLLFLSNALSCSNFMMEDAYGLSVRTEDTSPPPLTSNGTNWEDYQISLVTSPATTTSIAFVAFVAMDFGPHTAPLNSSQGIKAGLNIYGLSCDEQSLSETHFPSARKNETNIDAALLCRYSLENFENVSSLHAHLSLGEVNFVAPSHDTNNFGHQHWILRDDVGDSLVIEFVDGEMMLHLDGNDGGKTGFGVLTNSPEYLWQVRNMQLDEWKRSKYGGSEGIPGDWYPDSRFRRLAMIKSKMSTPSSLQQAVANAIHVANSVSVPPGSQPGKDMSSATSDHRTEFIVVYDHKNRAVYWRSVWNQNLARVELSELRLNVGDKQEVLLVKSREIPWYYDASKLFNSELNKGR